MQSFWDKIVSFQDRFAEFSEKYGVGLAYLAFGLVFFTYGIQKPLPVQSPVKQPVAIFVQHLQISTSSSLPFLLIGFYEMSMGLLFLFQRIRAAFLLFVPHQILTFFPLFLAPEIAFRQPWFEIAGFSIPWAFDWFAAFILKNTVFVGAFILLAARELGPGERSPKLGFNRYLGFVCLIGFLAVAGYSASTYPETQLYSYQQTSGSGSYSTGTQMFKEVSENHGLEYRAIRRPDERTAHMRNEGVYVSDVDNNGFPDVLLVGGRSPALFLNQNGTGFEEAQRFNELENEVISAHFMDFDQDAEDELFLLPHNSSPVYYENRNGSFYEDNRVETVDLKYPFAAAHADSDKDGCGELIIAQDAEGWPTGAKNTFISGDCEDFSKRYFWTENESKDQSLAVSFTDLNKDLYPDIHFANDASRDSVYLYNDSSDYPYSLEWRGKSTDRNGMSSEIADINTDGYPDILVTNIWENNLLVNQFPEKPIFEDRAPEYGVVRGIWGWTPIIEDFDNDGDLDIFHSTSADSEPAFPRYWENTEEGFKKRSASRLGFQKANGRGAAMLDFDRDGDVDILVMNSPSHITKSKGTLSPLLYENTLDEGNYLSFQLQDRNGTTAVGARAKVMAGEIQQTRYQSSRTNYLSQDSRILHVGLGKNENVTLQIRWPDGGWTEKTFEANQIVEVSK